MDFETGQLIANVHVVDDDDDCRKGFARVLSAAGMRAVEHRSVGEYLRNCDEGEDASDPESASCVLLDMYLKDSTGLDLLETLAKRHRAPPVVFVSGVIDIGNTVTAMRAGALDFLTKPVKAEDLVATVQRAIGRDVAQRHDRQHREELRARYEQLTHHEYFVFRGLVDGQLNKQIASELGSCERTVKTHRSRLMKKMGAQSIADLVRIASQLGLFD
jgi:FixJ family two-component response regulator